MIFGKELETLDFGGLFLIFLDIGIVSCLFYLIFTLISRTRAFQLLLGVVFILIADVTARYLKLETLTWIITHVSSYLVIGLLILAQPELRRVMTGLTKTRIFQSFYHPKPIPIKEITTACRNMASKRIGAILVILRTLKPQQIIDQAVPVHASISAELIETIFYKDTPLHDGAVIIEGAKILAASCYLPLSSSRNLKKTHGARYRAGLGMSEEIDSVVIVTSEESGRICIFQNGEIINTKSSELEPTLQHLLHKGAS